VTDTQYRRVYIVSLRQVMMMKPHLVRLLLLLLGATTTGGQLPGEEEAEDVPGCPPSCVCFRTTVRCMFLQLDAVPDVPDSTTIL